MRSDFGRLKGFLTGTPFFGGLDDASLDHVMALLGEKQIAKGETIYREGETGRSMYILEAGEVTLYRCGESGMQVKLVKLGPGDFFGETTLIEMQPRPASAVASEETRLLELTGSDLYRLYKEDIKAYVLVLQNMNRELCRRMRRADGRITKMADEAGDEETQIRTNPVRSRP